MVMQARKVMVAPHDSMAISRLAFRLPILISFAFLAITPCHERQVSHASRPTLNSGYMSRDARLRAREADTRYEGGCGDAGSMRRRFDAGYGDNRCAAPRGRETTPSHAAYNTGRRACYFHWPDARQRGRRVAVAESGRQSGRASRRYRRAPHVSARYYRPLL